MLHTIFEICGITSICIGLPFIIVLVAACWPELSGREGYGWKKATARKNGGEQAASSSGPVHTLHGSHSHDSEPSK